MIMGLVPRFSNTLHKETRVKTGLAILSSPLASDQYVFT